MTAQQQLAELMASILRGDAILGQSLKGRHATNRKCAQFLRDHGQAFDELLKAYLARQSAIELWCATDAGSKERVDACRSYDAADDAIFAALRKLTQEA